MGYKNEPDVLAIPYHQPTRELTIGIRRWFFYPCPCVRIHLSTTAYCVRAKLGAGSDGFLGLVRRLQISHRPHVVGIGRTDSG